MVQSFCRRHVGLVACGVAVPAVTPAAARNCGVALVHVGEDMPGAERLPAGRAGERIGFACAGAAFSAVTVKALHLRFSSVCGGSGIGIQWVG